jgi:hypothetical protein
MTAYGMFSEKSKSAVWPRPPQSRRELMYTVFVPARSLALNDFDKRPSRLIALPLALIFLFETWVWDKLMALARLVTRLLPWARFRDEARRVVGRLPAIFAVMLFGVPLAVSEGGAFVSVVMMATGHVFAGMTLYIAMKIFGLVLVPVIFEITREKLLALRWFAWLYAKFEALHAMAHRFVAPYKQAARDMIREGLARLRGWFQAPSAARASAAKPETSSSARAVGSSPTSSSP